MAINKQYMNSKLSFGQSIQAGLLAGVVAAVINAIIYFVFHAAGVLHDGVFVQPPNQPLTVVPVIVASLLPSVIGSIGFFLIEKFTTSGYRIFSILTIVLTALSMYSPFTKPINVTTGYALVLCLMHVVVAFTLLYFINRALKQRQLL